MSMLSQLKNISRPKKKIQRVGRGVGSKRGKTSCRGEKGDGSRSGYKRRYGYEGGQVPLYRKLPVRGFTRGRFIKPAKAITLAQLERHFEEGETVDLASLLKKGLISRRIPGGVKIISKGEITKKLKTVLVHSFSKSAREKLEACSIPCKEIKAQ